MDLKTLQLFQHLAGTLHFGQTADAMYVSPSTLSRAIQRLEDSLGVALFVRDNRSVTLTAAGRRTLASCQRILEEWQLLHGELDEQQQLLRGELSLFCSVTASLSHLPSILNRFRRAHPQVELKLDTGDPALSVRRVTEQSVDVSIAIHTPDFPAELRFLLLDHIPLLLIAPKALGLTRLSEVDWRKHPMILPDSGPSKRIVHHWFAEQGIRPRVYASVGGNEAIVSMVALGCGIGIVPQVVVDHSIAGQSVSRIAIPNIEDYPLGLCCLQKRAQEPAIKALFNEAAQAWQLPG
ncbi:HTH-type transcriptional activator IlvY [Aestuariibacter halophilus]|uniref:HTH-type transcriptional activator IlvY n=1 Tax=Fluctibacter halophilus TaxID=226011 RepID=A0ABS8G8T8_9ALTE|nr:HTH-type transcriptional activator IlvY [Aestuariibacter halophilus]MCC2616994.1 HTH-type transcriptional activator IlvY [Aestuariibacter halophilus]